MGDLQLDFALAGVAGSEAFAEGGKANRIKEGDPKTPVFFLTPVKAQQLIKTQWQIRES